MSKTVLLHVLNVQQLTLLYAQLVREGINFKVVNVEGIVVVLFVPLVLKVSSSLLPKYALSVLLQMHNVLDVLLPVFLSVLNVKPVIT